MQTKELFPALVLLRCQFFAVENLLTSQKGASYFIFLILNSHNILSISCLEADLKKILANIFMPYFFKI